MKNPLKLLNRRINKPKPPSDYSPERAIEGLAALAAPEGREGGEANALSPLLALIRPQIEEVIMKSVAPYLTDLVQKTAAIDDLLSLISTERQMVHDCLQGIVASTNDSEAASHRLADAITRKVDIDSLKTLQQNLRQANERILAEVGVVRSRLSEISLAAEEMDKVRSSADSARALVQRLMDSDLWEYEATKD